MAKTKSGIYYIDDYNEQADTPAYSQKLAESIDEAFLKEQEDISNIKDEQKKQSEDIEKNKAINEENSNSINAVLNAMPTAKGEGEQVTLKNTMDFKFKKFKNKGNSKQETRSGKNAIVGIYRNVGTNQINYSIDASVLTSNIIYFSLISSVTLQTTNRIYIKDGNTVIASKKAITVNANSKAIIKINLTDEELSKIKSATNLILQLYENNTNIDYTKVTFSEVMLSSNSDSDYEEYGATPSTKFSSKIKNVGDNINIFNKNGSFIGYQTKTEVLDKGIKVINLSSVKYASAYTRLGGEELLGKTITLSSDIEEAEGATANVLLYFGTELKPSSGGVIQKINNNSKNNGLWNIPSKFPDGCDRINLYFYGSGAKESTVNSYVNYNNLKVEVRNKPSPYSEYSCGSMEIIICNKNILNQDLELFQGNYANNGNVITNSDRRIDKYIFLAKGNYILWSTINNWINVLIYDKNKKLLSIKNSNTNKEIAFTLDEDGYIRFGFNPTVESLKVFQLERNTEKTTSEEHKQQIIVFPFKKGQRLMEGDYLAEDGIHHKRKQIILDEKSLIGLYKHDNIDPDMQGFYVSIDGVILNSKIVSSHFKNDSLFKTKESRIYCYQNNTIYFIVDKTVADNIDNLKAYIAAQKEAGTPVLIEYELAEEEVESYTEAQKEAWKQIKNARSYEGQTNIYCDNETSAIIEAEAYANINLIINNLQAQIISNASEGV